jgi:hypothetical protein
VIPALRFEDLLRPAMMSTSAMAPVIQLDLSGSRNDTAFVMSFGRPGAGYAGCPLSPMTSSNTSRPNLPRG